MKFEIGAEVKICVSATIDGALIRLPNGSDGDTGAIFAGRLEDLYVQRGGKVPPAPPGTPPRKFDREERQKGQCNDETAPRVIVRYRKLPNDEPYGVQYVVSDGRHTVQGMVDEDLSKRKGWGKGILEWQSNPTSDIIQAEMPSHAQRVLNILYPVRNSGSN